MPDLTPAEQTMLDLFEHGPMTPVGALPTLLLDPHPRPRPGRRSTDHGHGGLK